MNSPSSTTMRTTAKTMPVSVTANRTLSCTRLRQASIFTLSPYVTVLTSVQKKSALAQPLDEDADQPVDDVLGPAPIEPRNGDEERRDPMDGGPERLARHERVGRRDLLLLDAGRHHPHEDPEGRRAH